MGLVSTPWDFVAGIQICSLVLVFFGMEKQFTRTLNKSAKQNDRSAKKV